MAENTVFIEEEGPRLECLLEVNDGTGGVVITHPHPLYGGDMDNHVVEAVSRVYAQNGITAMRFNFRGVGRSEGTFDHGIGEQDDVIRALAYLSEIGKSDLHLAGYSFGAWVNWMALKSLPNVAQMVMVSPPVAFLKFGETGSDSRLKLVISGSDDDLSPESMLRDACRRWNPLARLEIVQGADHFYSGKLPELRRILDQFLGSPAKPPGGSR